MRERRKQMVGQVVSNKMEKTVVVEVQQTRQHRLYGKVIRVSKRYMAHDENGASRMGDAVRIIESRPYSKNKHWEVLEVLQQAEQIDKTPLQAEQAAE